MTIFSANIREFIKQKLNAIAFFKLFGQKNNEFEQGVIRVVFTGLILLYVLLNSATISLASQICVAYLIVGILMLSHITISPNPNPKRQWVAMLMDITAVSYELFLANEIGSILIGVYLWLIVGYGLRYGAQLLIGAHITSLLGFSFAVYFNAYWQNHMHMVYGLLIMLLLVPLHTLRLVTKLNQALQKSEMASRAKSQFLSHISHEIRTPLNGIVGAADLLKAAQLNHEQKHLLQIIGNSSSLLGQLVNNVLDLATIESGKMPVHFRPFNLQAVLNDSLSLFEPQATDKNIQLLHHYDDEIPPLLIGDELHIKQVLVNLLGNAVKFTSQGTVTLRVKQLSHRGDDVSLKFEVIDTGIGIAESALNRIFESFTQANAAIKYNFGGTGLGTTISKQLVTLMGGKMGVESTEGLGTIFWFELPLKQQPPQTNMAQTTLAETTKPPNIAHANQAVIALTPYLQTPPKAMPHILVADDNETNRIIIAKVLEQAGYPVDLVADGEQALDKLEVKQYDLMILDSSMPELSGLDVLKMHRFINAGLTQTPAIILSADATADTIESFKLAGAEAYLTKPIHAPLLIEKIQNLTATQAHYQAEIIPYNIAKADAKNGNALIDYTRLDELAALGNNVMFIQVLLEGFLSDSNQKLQELKCATNPYDYIALSHIGHALAGSASNVGAKALANIAQQINHIKPTDADKTIIALIDQAQSTFENTKPLLHDYLQAYANKSTM